MAKRTWTLGANPETGRVDPDELAQRMVDLASMLQTVGGCFNVAAVRQEQPTNLPGEYALIGVVFQWDSFVPAVEPSTPEEAQAAMTGLGEELPDVDLDDRSEEPEDFPDTPSLAEPQPAEA